jgi:hypothetical protein
MIYVCETLLTGIHHAFEKLGVVEVDDICV